MAPWVGCVVGLDTATAVTAAAAAAADETTLDVAVETDAAADEAGGVGFGGSCDFAPYSMYCKIHKLTTRRQLPVTVSE